ncbi:MAG TPA: J domain-containing protein [Verrucomicrobiae bacterium]|nr:J domain-containing protein [Verrucomicrobiae bacterium]
MSPTGINIWLTRKRRRGIENALCYGAATVLGGAFVIALMFCVLFVTAKTTLLSAFPLYSIGVTVVSALIALIVNALIFADSVKARRDDMTFLPSWLLREYISIGPRLVLEGWPHVRRVRRFSQMDIETSAKVLTFLAGKATPTFCREVLARFPEADWTRLTDDLSLLSGVIFFRPDGLRVSLTTPLRLELRTLLAHQKIEEVPEPDAVPIEEPHKLTPAEILGVLPTASLAQIKTAYRSRIKECHPDRFAAMDEHSRSLAEEWTKSLNAAYELLVRETRGQNWR